MTLKVLIPRLHLSRWGDELWPFDRDETIAYALVVVFAAGFTLGMIGGALTAIGGAQ